MVAEPQSRPLAPDYQPPTRTRAEPHDESQRDPRRHRSPNLTVLRVLTFTQNTSALVFSVFLPIHASPIAAAFGGISAADKVLLLSREYYLPRETLTIYAPLILHFTSSLLKRLYLLSLTRRRPPLSTHLLSGWLLLTLVPVHIWTHRLAPSSSTPPISSLSPSELGYDYVGWNLRRWPISSGLAYLGMVGLGVMHAGIGMMKVVSWLRGPRTKISSKPDTNSDSNSDIVDTRSSSVVNGGSSTLGVEGAKTKKTNLDPATSELEQKRVVPRQRKIGLRGLVFGLLAIVGVGLGRIARGSYGISRVMEGRYEAVYASLPWASFLR